MVEKRDFVVIGAGIAGASVCARLAQSASVALLEAEERPGYHSTGRSAASWIENYGNENIVKLNRASFDFLNAPPDDFPTDSLLHERGVLWTALPGQEDTLAAALNDDVVAATAAEALARVPALRSDSDMGFAWEEAAFDIDVARLHDGFLKQAKRGGATLHCNARVDDVTKTPSGWRVSAGDDVFETPVVVNAAGAWADTVASLAGARPAGLTPLRRSAAMIPVPDEYEPSDWPMVVNVAESFYFRPDGGSLMLSPADTTPVEPHDAYADDMAIAEAADVFGRTMTFPVTRVTHTWGGLRTFAPDKTPVVGMDALDGFFWLAGQGGYGIQTSPAMAMLASDLLLGNTLDAQLQKVDLDPEELSPRRFD